MYKYKRKKALKKKKASKKKVVRVTDPNRARYEMEKKLGEGAFAVVHVVTEKETNKKYAMKSIDLYEDSGYDIKNKEVTLKRATKEVKILQQLLQPNKEPSPYCVGIKEAFLDTNGRHYCIVQELLTGIDMANYIEKKKKYAYNDTQIKKIICHLFSSLAYLHSRNIVHRDIKADNIMIDVRDGQTKIKIIDFGYACRMDVNHNNELFCTYGDDRFYGTKVYMAPERFWNYEVDGADTFDTLIEDNPDWWAKGDVYAMGIVIYELATRFLFDDNHEPLQTKAQKKAKTSSKYLLEVKGEYTRPSGIDYSKIKDPLIREIVELATTPEPDARPGALEILEYMADAK